MATSLSRFVAVAQQLADTAARHTLSHFRSQLAVDNKIEGGFDPVTVADRDAEAAMRDIIASSFPDHGVVGEEFDPLNEGADYVWVLDPIDGTRAYIIGLPIWGTLIGLLHQGRPILGLMDQPFTQERFYSDAEAAWYRGPRSEAQRLNTRKPQRLSEAHLTATAPDMFKGENAASFQKLASKVRMQRYGGDCYAYAMLALGHIDIVAEAGLKPVDIVPLVPIIEKAGGVVTSWDGGSPLSGGACVAVGDPELLPQILEELRPKA
jgi:histidinol phosphatase-like enzyme (inositol monophosphatase family)